MDFAEIAVDLSLNSLASVMVSILICADNMRELWCELLWAITQEMM